MKYNEEYILFDQTETTDNYVYCENIRVIYFPEVLMWLKNQSTAYSIDYIIEGTLNYDDWETIKEGTTLTVGESYAALIEDPWSYVKLGIKSTSVGQHGEVEAHVNLR